VQRLEDLGHKFKGEKIGGEIRPVPSTHFTSSPPGLPSGSSKDYEGTSGLMENFGEGVCDSSNMEPT